MMAFTFGFSGDDIEDEGPDDETSTLEAAVEQCTITEPKSLIRPRSHSLEELLRDLPSQISYNLLPITKTSGDVAFSIARRSVFDVRTQLMAEAVPEENNNDVLLEGLDRGDLTSGFYEGGFKTWECALDLASLVADAALESGMHIIEVGAGSAIPSLTLLRRILRENRQQQQCQEMHFTLCDYNEDVLRLATAPNIFLTQQMGSQPADPQTDQADRELEIEDIDAAKVSSSCQDWAARNTTFNFVSGAWGDEFVQLVHQATGPHHHTSNRSRTLILASETIYSPASTKIFAETLMQLLQKDAANTKAWIAAKVIYFGVGGGVEDFTHEIRQRNGCLRTILEIKSAGVGRVVLEVTANQETSSSG